MGVLWPRFGVVFMAINHLSGEHLSCEHLSGEHLSGEHMSWNRLLDVGYGCLAKIWCCFHGYKSNNETGFCIGPDANPSLESP